MLRTGVGMSSAQIVTVLAGIGIGLLLARGLGVDGYGRYIFALTVVQILLVPLDFGLPTLVMRQVAVYRSQGDWGALAGLLRWSAGLATAVLGVVGLGAVAWFWLWPGADALSGETRALYLFAVALAGVWAFMRLAGAVLRGLERVFWGSLPDQVIRPLVFLGAVAAVPLVIDLTPSLAMALHTGAAAAGLAWALWMLWRRCEIIPPGAAPAAVYHTRAWLRSLLPLGMIVGAGLINSRLDVFMLGVLATPEEVGIYGLAVLIAGVVSMPQTIVNSIIAPRIARLNATGEREEMQRLASHACLLSSLGGLVTLAAIALLGAQLVDAAVGASFAPAVMVALVAGAGHLTATMLGPVALLLNMTGHEKATAKLVWMSAALNAALNLILIPVLGALGAAVATVITVTAIRLVLRIIVGRKLGLQPDVFSLAATWSNRGNSNQTAGIRGAAFTEDKRP